MFKYSPAQKMTCVVQRAAPAAGRLGYTGSSGREACEAQAFFVVGVITSCPFCFISGACGANRRADGFRALKGAGSPRPFRQGCAAVDTGRRCCTRCDCECGANRRSKYLHDMSSSYGSCRVLLL